MRKYYNIPLVFLSLAAGVGLFLRWQFVVPTPGVRYTFFLHSHSHVMFLGWVFNVLFLSFAEHNLPQNRKRSYISFFLVLQLLVAAMMISFPIQGYGVFSIIFSTLHTLAVMIFIPVFFRLTKGDKRVSTWFARVAWIFFFLSTAGPFSLGYIMANNPGQSVWYNFSIYYYLHFQYNGFFLFGILSLFFQMLESKGIPFVPHRILAFGKWMAFACVPAYALSILFASPGMFFNLIGAAAALVQLLAIAYFIRDMASVKEILRERFNPFTLRMLQIILAAFVFKCILQLASAHQLIAELAYSMRPVVISYLHLVLVGVISLFLLSWYIDRQLVDSRARAATIVLLAGFFGSELCLVLTPWWSSVFPAGWPSPVVIFGFSVLMLAGILIFLASFRNAVHDENQFSG